MQECKISFLMTTYNDMRLFDMSVGSLLSQDFSDWELLILDNSDNEKPWEKISAYAASDSRICAFRSAKNVGWAKGTSELLKKASGEYMTFLAADDFINAGILTDLNVVMEDDHPDVIMVGNAYVEVSDDLNLKILGGNSPYSRKYGKENRSKAISEILHDTYYNSLFHYCKCSFLRENDIDFFDPYYGDCGGMTAALCKAHTISVFDKVVYLLSMNTSQTYGKYIWDYYRVISGQWRDFKEVFRREDYEAIDDIRFVAEKVFDHYAHTLDILMNNGVCRDKYMNVIQVNEADRKKQVADMLSDTELMDMFTFLGQVRLRDALAAYVSG